MAIHCHGVFVGMHVIFLGKLGQTQKTRQKKRKKERNIKVFQEGGKTFTKHKNVHNSLPFIVIVHFGACLIKGWKMDYALLAISKAPFRKKIS